MSCLIKRILQLKEAINFVQLKLFNPQQQDITNECLYAWSTDGVCWTNWVSYNDYLKIGPNLESDFYLRVLLFGPFEKIFIGGVNTICYTIVIDSTNEFLQDFCDSPNLFQPYQNLDCALQLQQQLSDSIVCMLGIPIYYIKVDPELNSADYTFKEYSLHNVSAIKQIKLMIPDGEMPSSNPKLTELDFDWETDWDVEISKTQFARAFGDTAFPKSRDFIYIPMMKRMWEVNSAYDEKKEGLLWRSTTWKLALLKYNDATNIGYDGFEEVIDGWVNNQEYETQLEPLEKNEQERLTGNSPLTAPSFAATNLFNIFMEDAVRKQYTKDDALIIDKMYCHHSNVVARNLYKFKNGNGCITYQKGICGESGTLMFILELMGTLNGPETKNIINFGPVKVDLRYDNSSPEAKFYIIYNGMEQALDPLNTYMVVLDWNRDNFSTGLNIYKYTHRMDIPIYKLKPELYWFDYENPIATLTAAYNNDFILNQPQECLIHTYPAQITNIKYYNKCLDRENAIKESIKYTTQHKNCIINDLARPIDSGHGYTVK